MSVINRERAYKSLTDTLEFVLEQAFKEIYTQMPGIIEAYDPETRRCKVRGAMRIVRSGGVKVARSPLVNVPVIFPCGGGYTMYFPLKPGDIVWIEFSMRGLTEFKKTFDEADPTMSSLMDERDAVVNLGFGTLTMTPADEDGVSIQDKEGENYVLIYEDGVKIKTEQDVTVDAEQNVRIESGQNITIEASQEITLRAPTITFDGNVVGDNP